MKLAITKVNGRVFAISEIKELNAREYAICDNEAKENQKNIKNTMDRYELEIEALLKEVELLKHEIKVLKGEE